MGIRIAALVFALGLLPSALAQQNVPATPQDKPEEVLITGQRVQQLRKDMMAAEVNAYDAFNQFNDEKRFNISCSTHQPTGSHFEKQTCQPAFEIRATADHGRDYFENVRDMLNQFADAQAGGRGMTTPDENTQPTYIPVEAVIAAQQDAYHRKLKQVAEQHPEFLDAVIRYSKLRQQYEQAARSGSKD